VHVVLIVFDRLLTDTRRFDYLFDGSSKHFWKAFYEACVFLKEQQDRLRYNAFMFIFIDFLFCQASFWHDMLSMFGAFLMVSFEIF
jgi:hypothetical protein